MTDIARGSIFIAGQIFILGAISFGPLIDLTPWECPDLLRSIGVLLIFIGGLLMFPSFISLGRSLTPSPIPKKNGLLVTTGTYKWVRHPMYSALICMSFGWTIAASSLVSGIMSVLLLLFLNNKANLEEKLLLKKFGWKYEEYSKATGKFTPHLKHGHRWPNS